MQFAVIGAGRFGTSVAQALSQKGCEVLVIDSDPEKVQEINEIATHAVTMDATDDKALKAVGIENIDVAIVSIAETLESSILVTMILKELGVKTVISKARTLLHGKLLQKVGADRVIFPERDMGTRLANNLVSPDIFEQIEISPGYNIAELEIPKALDGKTLNESGIRKNFNINVIAIKSKNDNNPKGKISINITPTPNHLLKEGDVIVVIGETDKIEKFKEL
ncbi:MAG: TrkA family potassium uptake protein [bacterium]|nr:TrkA family potassium uptake protein [bacterium]